MNIEPWEIDAAITQKITAILPVHVFGNPCEIDEIQRIVDTNGLKLIYDAAHPFGAMVNGKSLCSFGDMSVLKHKISC